MSKMTDTQFGVLYKMVAGWRLRSSMAPARVWLASPKSVTVLNKGTLRALSRNLWVTQIEMKWPILRWELTGQGREALRQEEIKRGAVLRGRA
jgi:hypothetical protein